MTTAILIFTAWIFTASSLVAAAVTRTRYRRIVNVLAQRLVAGERTRDELREKAETAIREALLQQARVRSLIGLLGGLRAAVAEHDGDAGVLDRNTEHLDTGERAALDAAFTRVVDPRLRRAPIPRTTDAEGGAR